MGGGYPLCPKCVHSTPFQSRSVTYARDRCAYVVDLSLVRVESTAFTRQGRWFKSSRAHHFFLCLQGFLTEIALQCLKLQL